MDFFFLEGYATHPAFVTPADYELAGKVARPTKEMIDQMKKDSDEDRRTYLFEAVNARQGTVVKELLQTFKLNNASVLLLYSVAMTAHSKVFEEHFDKAYSDLHSEASEPQVKEEACCVIN